MGAGEPLKVKEFGSSEELLRHYAELRKRTDPQPSPVLSCYNTFRKHSDRPMERADVDRWKKQSRPRLRLRDPPQQQEVVVPRLELKPPSYDPLESYYPPTIDRRQAAEYERSIRARVREVISTYAPELGNLDQIVNEVFVFVKPCDPHEVQMRQARRLLGETSTEFARKVRIRIEDERGLERGAIMGESRLAVIVAARHDAICEVYLHYQELGQNLSLGKLAGLFGHLDHTTILHVLRKRGLR